MAPLPHVPNALLSDQLPPAYARDRPASINAACGDRATLYSGFSPAPPAETHTYCPDNAIQTISIILYPCLLVYAHPHPQGTSPTRLRMILTTSSIDNINNG